MHQTDLKGQIRKPLESRLSGSYGIALIPDDKTAEVCQELSRDLLPENAEFLPLSYHITLYHGQIKDAPSDRLFKITDRIAHLVGASFELNVLQVFGGKFLFFNLDPDPRIASAHKEALHMATFLDKDALSRAEEEGLDLSQAQQENLKKYGHPLVGDLHIPHITLGYASDLSQGKLTHYSQKMTVKSVTFAKIGSYGSVEESLYEL